MEISVKVEEINNNDDYPLVTVEFNYGIRFEWVTTEVSLDEWEGFLESVDNNKDYRISGGDNSYWNCIFSNGKCVLEYDISESGGDSGIKITLSKDNIREAIKQIISEIKKKSKTEDKQEQEQQESYDGKILKKILISKKGYDGDILNIYLGCRNKEDKYDKYVLKKLVKVNDVNVYGLDCDVPLHGDMIRVGIVGDNIPELKSWSLINMAANLLNTSKENTPKENDFVWKRSVIYRDDRDYNHVKDMCNGFLFDPDTDQTSYGVYINLVEPCQSAISLFITN